MRTSLLFCALFFVSCRENGSLILTSIPPARSLSPKVISEPHKNIKKEFPQSLLLRTPSDPGVLSNRRQITFAGTRNENGYFNRNGKEMLFRSERSNNPWQQIYLMNLETGDSRLIPTGKGRVTQAIFHPSGRKILFAKQKGSKTYDETFDLFELPVSPIEAPRRLTSEPGYDGEASYSPDGRQIVFASNRQAFSDKLKPAEQNAFESDPSVMIELYLMNADGGRVKRLTFEKGYDAEPSFLPDGRKILWRRQTINGQISEVMTMFLDGSDVREITHLRALSTSPISHPSGEYVVFSSNALGSDNTELFIVDTEGRQEPFRVTDWEGLDDNPHFSPDGQKLSWTHHNSSGEAQIYLADWNDQKARELLKLASSAKHNSFLGKFSPEDARTIVEYMSSDTLEGRLSGSPQEELYVQYLSELFKELGFEPAGTQGFLQPFNFTTGEKLGPQQKMSLKIGDQIKNLILNLDYTPLSFSNSGDFGEAAVVFAGFGMIAPAHENQSRYNSYQNLDVKNKWVLAFRDSPPTVSEDRRVHLNRFSDASYKALLAREHGAKGLILINSSKDKLGLRYEGSSFGGIGLPVLSVTENVASQILKPFGKSLQQLHEELDKGNAWTDPADRGEIKNLKVAAKIELIQEKATGYNVLARLKVPGSKETVVVGAHGDHLGRGVQGLTQARGNEWGRIHYGADDNASGVAALMQLAEEWSVGVRKGKLHPKQDVIFAVWSGSKLGLLGSNYFLRHTDDKITAYLNLDMVGRLRETLFVQGLGSPLAWATMFEKIAARTNKNSSATAFSISFVGESYSSSDAMSFYLQGIPGLEFSTGGHSDDRTPRDIPALLNYPGISKVSEVVSESLKEIVSGRDSSSRGSLR